MKSGGALKKWATEKPLVLTHLPASRGALSRDEAALILQRSLEQPEFFPRTVLGVSLWSMQRQILNSIIGQHTRVAVKACHASGKSYAAGVIAMTFVHLFTPSVVVTTAPTLRQVSTVLWKEIHTIYRRARKPLGGRMLQLSYTLSDDTFVIGLTTDDADKFQGHHCLDRDHEILTRRGWLGIDDITEQDEVLSVPIDGTRAEWMPITKIHRYPYRGHLLTYKSPFVDFAVTPNHRFVWAPVIQSEESWLLSPLNEVARRRVKLRRVSSWRGDPFVVPEVFAKYELTQEQFADFIGWWVTEGSVGGLYEVAVYQTKPEMRKLLADVLAPFQPYEIKGGYAFSDRDVVAWLIEHCGRYSHERKLPRMLLDAPKSVLRRLLQAMLLGDGSDHQIYTTSTTLAGQIQEIGFKIGRPASVGVNRVAGARISNPLRRGWLRPNHTCYVVGVAQTSRNAIVDVAETKWEWYRGHVWCISTPYQTFLTRRNGKAFWSGNSENILVIVDEAPGVEEDVFEAIEGVMAGGNARLLLIGNPTSLEGSFYRAFNDPAYSRLFRKFTISAFDTPNVKSGKEVIRGLVTKQWVEERKRLWGEDHPLYQIKVLGEFPGREFGDLVIPPSFIERAGNIVIKPLPDDEVILGVDIGELGGDETTVALRKGQRLYWTDGWVDATLPNTTQRILDRINKYNVQEVRIDKIGVGAGVYDSLKELERESKGRWRVVGIDVREKPVNPEKYADCRSEMWFEFREALRHDRIDFSQFYKNTRDADVTIAQLTSPKFAPMPNTGLIKVETKKEMRQRKLPSPDRADAVVMAFYDAYMTKEPTVNIGTPSQLEGIMKQPVFTGWGFAEEDDKPPWIR